MALNKLTAITLAGRKFTLLVFDLDGVLVSTSPCHESAYQELWDHIGLTGPEYAAIAGRRTVDVIRDVTMSLEPTERQIHTWTQLKQQRAREMIVSGDICFSDTLEVLETLFDHGIPLALGTSASKKSTQLILERYGLRRFFSLVVNAEKNIRGKPEADIYTKVISDLGASAESTLIIEDSVAGLEAAIAADAHVISVRTGLSVANSFFLGAFPDLGVLIGAVADRS